MDFSSLSLLLSGEKSKSREPMGRDCAPVEPNTPRLGTSQLVVLVDCVESAGEKGQVLGSSWKSNPEAALGGPLRFAVSQPFASSNSGGG
jgi:hypothetical protein